VLLALAVLAVALVMFYSRRIPALNISFGTTRALSVADLYNKVSPALVIIHSEAQGGAIAGLGSGFIIDKDGTIVTNYHVVQGATRLRITLADSTVLFTNSVIGFNQEKDLALLRVAILNPSIIEVAPEGYVPTIGEKVYAIGNPQGLRGTLSEGIISGIRQNTPYGDMIQTTAPISSGSSGGPLLNEEGKAIGIIVAMLKGGQNLNFAIPTSSIRDLGSKGNTPAPVAALPETEDRTASKEQAAAVAVLAITEGRSSEGYTIAEQLIRKWPDFALAWYAKGYALQEMGENVEAVEALNWALSLSPQPSEAYFPLGQALFKLAQFEQAIEAFKNSNRYSAAANTYFNIGLSYLRLDKKRNAIENFEQAVRLKPDFADAHHLSCECYLGLGDTDTALLMCERAIRYDPRHVDARFTLGMAYIQRGQYDKAYAHMVALSSLAPAKAHLLESALQGVAQREQAARQAEAQREQAARQAEAQRQWDIQAEAQRRQADLEAQAQRVWAAQQAAQQAAQLAEARRQQAAHLNDCLSNSHSWYISSWDDLCWRLHLGGYDRCRLPTHLANELDTQLRDLRNDCYMRFPQR
jgi:serine protease Do